MGRSKSKQAEGLTSAQKRDIVLYVKRLNERMAELERRGMTNTRAYSNLSAWVSSMPNRVNAAGNKRAVQTAKLTPYQIARTKAIVLNREASYNFEKYDAIRRIEEAINIRRAQQNKPTDFVLGANKHAEKLIKTFANRAGDLHNFIINHVEAYYGTDLHKAVQRSDKLTADEEARFYALMEDSNKAEEKNKATWEQWARANSWGETKKFKV